jgi:hypothetical protein
MLLSFQSPTTSFTEFFPSAKQIWGRIYSFELKNIFKFLDNENLGYFTQKRWNDFFDLFISPFSKCDKNGDCFLDKSELSDCLKNKDMSVVIDYLPDGITEEILVQEIIFTLDNRHLKGLTFNDYLLLKKIIIGFRHYNVQGKIDSQGFYSAIKTIFIDRLIDQTDSELAFRVGIELMYDTIKFFQMDFLQFFETSRIINAFTSHDLSISEGFLTKENILHNFEGDRFPSKITRYMFEDYFSIFEEDKKFDINLNDDFTYNSLRFEDYALLEFYANIFRNYTDPSTYHTKLNINGFSKLLSSNKYIRKKYLIYISYSNYEETQNNKTNTNKNEKENENDHKTTDYDFLTNYRGEFLEIESSIGALNLNKKESLRKNLIKKMNLKGKINYEF